MEEQQQIESGIIEEKYKGELGENLIRKYQKGKLLGKGGFAKCYEVLRLDNKRLLAAKIIQKNTLKRSRTKQKLITEIKLHQSLHHQNIVQFEHVFEDHENVYILLELCQNQTLNELIKIRRRITQIETQCYVNQLIGALKYIHTHRIIHRDLKLGNLFINDKMELKLGDFGLATKLDYDGQMRKTICGTPNYIAPEILNEHSGHSYAADIWSLGVIIYTLLIGKPPFETSDVKLTYNKIKQCQYNFPEHIQISDNAKHLISNILILDQTKRLSLDEILNHPFMTSNQIPKQTQLSSLISPPSNTWLQQFQQNKQSQGQLKQQIESKQIIDCQEIPLNKQKLFDQIKIKSFTNQINKSNIQQKIINQTIFVLKCCDYTNKYGIGYVLSNNIAGVLFNDSTKIYCFNKNEFYYKDNNQEQKKYSFFEIDKSLNLDKKQKLLTKFFEYLSVDENTELNNPEIVYVEKYLKTKNALLLKLSNGTIQSNFIDKSILIIFNNEQLYFINENGKKQQITLKQIEEDKDKEKIFRRYQYIQQLRSGCFQQ